MHAQLSPTWPGLSHMANPDDIDPRDTNYVPPSLLRSGLVGPNALSLLGTKEPLTDRELLVKWLATFDIHLEQAQALDTNMCPEFADGVILARLLEQLENTRGSIPG